MEVNNIVVSSVGWRAALADAELQLREAEQRAQQLKDVIAVFSQKMKDGEAWPDV
jgi:hypothetical protein